MKKHLFIAMLFFIFTPLHADFSSINGVAGMGLSDCYYPDRFSSVPINPAAGANGSRSELLGSYYLLYDNTSANYSLMGYKQSIGDYSIAFLWSHLSRNNIEVRQTLTSEPDSYTYSYQSCYYLSAAGPLIYGIDFGLSVKALNYEIYDFTSNYAFGADLGLSRTLFKTGSILSHQYSMTASAAFINVLQPQLTLNMDTEVFPSTARLSLLTKITTSPRYDMKNETFVYDDCSIFLDALNDGTWSSGFEYRRDKYMLRAGYNPSLDIGWSLGFGLDFNTFTVDYSFRPTDFSDLHFLEFDYKFGEAPEQNKTPREMTDYLNEEKKAERLYNNYFGKAESLFDKKSYSDALEILNKIIVLFPDRKAVRVAIEKNTNSLVSGQMNQAGNDFLADISAKDYKAAYEQLLKAVDISPQSVAVSQMLSTYDSADPNGGRAALTDPLKSDFLRKCGDNIDKLVDEKDFNAAKLELKKIAVIDPKGELVYIKDNLINTGIQTYSADLVKRAMQFAGEDKYTEAYYLFREAHRVNDDAAIAFQMENMRGKVKVAKNPGDEMYLKKCYLIAAVAFVNDEADEARATYYRIKQANPLFNCDVLEDRLLKAKIIERNLP